jgi:hypothetical protein
MRSKKLLAYAAKGPAQPVKVAAVVASGQVASTTNGGDMEFK